MADRKPSRIPRAKAKRPSPGQYVRAPAPRVAVKKRKAMNNFDLQMIFDDICNTVSSAVNKPIVLAAVLVAVAVILTHSNFSQGVIGNWVDNNPNNTLAKWIDANQKRFIGLIVFAPAVLDSPKNIQFLLGLSTIFWVMLVPESSVVQYLIQSVVLHTYFRVKQKTTRVFLLFFVAAAWYFGWIFVDPIVGTPAPVPPSVLPPTTTTTTKPQMG